MFYEVAIPVVASSERSCEIIADNLSKAPVGVGAAAQRLIPTGEHSLRLCCNHRTRSEEHQAKEVFFDIELLDTLRQHSPRFVVWPWSC